jgi:V8-like Glu-specific endopeptidase
MSTPKQPSPLTARTVQRRRGVDATEEFPSEPQVELSRVWLPSRDQPEVTAKRVKGRRPAVTLEARPDVAGSIVEPPPIRAEKITARTVRGVSTDDESRTAGVYPAHLPLRYAPKLVEKVRTRKIREGNDLPNSVFAPDSRYIFKDTSFPWCTAGRVQTPNGSGTGTMIGRRLMVTASHLMQWTATAAGWVKFTPSYYNGSAPFGIAWGTRVIYWSRVDGSDGVSDQETAFDYVLIVLDRNMGDLTGYVGYRTYSDSWNGGKYWQQIGYPADLSSTLRPAFFGGGAITSVESKSTSGQSGYVMGNFIDTFPGHSGGPYWGWWDEEPWPRLVGTDSTSPKTPGDDTSGDNEAGGGPALSSLITYARQKYP